MFAQHERLLWRGHVFEELLTHVSGDVLLRVHAVDGAHKLSVVHLQLGQQDRAVLGPPPIYDGQLTGLCTWGAEALLAALRTLVRREGTLKVLEVKGRVELGVVKVAPHSVLDLVLYTQITSTIGCCQGGKVDCIHY